MVLSRQGRPRAGRSEALVDVWVWSRSTASGGVRDAWVEVSRWGGRVPVVFVAAAVGLLVAAAWWPALRWRGLVRGAAVPVSLVAAGVFTQLVAKPLLGRPIGRGLVDAYPSGHATGTAAVAAAFVLVAPPLLRRAWPLLVAYSGLVGVAMWVTHSHYPTDVWAGWVVGASMAVLVASFLPPVAPSRAEPGAQPEPAGAVPR